MIRIAGLFVALLCLSSMPARAQEAPAADAVSLPTVSGTAAPAAQDPAKLAPADWIKIGGAWGPNKAWQVGFDKSATLGACAFLGVAKGQGPKFILGPCRDFVLLAKNGVPVYHVGIEALGYDVLDVQHSHPYYLARFGFSVGPAAAQFLDGISSRVPYIETLSDWKAPEALQYLGKISTVDGGGGPGVGVKPVYGAALKVNIPLQDLYNLVAGAGGK